MRALFANYFCHFLSKTFEGFVLHIAEYRIDLFYVYGIDKIAYRHLQKLRTFCIVWPDRRYLSVNSPELFSVSFTLLILSQHDSDDVIVTYC